MSSQHNVHDDISGNTTTMIPMCLATTKTWTSRKRQTTVGDFNILTLSKRDDLINPKTLRYSSLPVQVTDFNDLHLLMYKPQVNRTITLFFVNAKFV